MCQPKTNYLHRFLCSWDYVKITNEKDQEFGQDKYCGQQTGQTVLVTGKYILIKFHSDHTLQKRGFVMYFTAFPLGKYNENISTILYNRGTAQQCMTVNFL